MRRRPLCLLSLLITLWVLLSSGIGKEELSYPEELEGLQVTITGQVCGLEYKNEKQRIYLNNISNEESNTNLNLSKVLIFNQKEQNISYGNRIRVEGLCSIPEKASNPGQFDMQSYYRTQGIDVILQKAKVCVVDNHVNFLMQSLDDLKRIFCRGLNQALGVRYGSVMSAMLLGEKGGLDEELQALFRAGGIAHILAISGLHISMIGMGIYQAVRRGFGGFLIPGLTGGGFLILYGIMTGMSVSAKRAVLMFLVYLGAQILGRTYDMLSAMALACICILLEEPRYLYQAGFQLSFLAVLGIGVLRPGLRALFSEKNRLAEVFCAGLAIQMATLACTLYWFSEFGTAGFLLNIAVIPMAGVAMAFGAAGGILYLIWPAPGVLAAAPCHYILRFYETICLAAEKLTGNFGIWGAPGVWKIFLYYTMLIGMVLVIYRCIKKKHFRTGKVVLAGTAAASVLLLWIRIPQGLEMTFLDVGQGDCIFWQSDTGRTYLCDGGSSTQKNVGTYRIEPFLKWKGVGKLDYLLVTHMDEDHINGVCEILDIHTGGIQVGCLVLPQIQTEDEDYQRLQMLAKKRGIPVRLLKSGDRLQDGKLSIRCLWPEALEKVGKENKNEYSMVIQLDYGKFRALLTGDLEGIGEERILESGRLKRTDLLKVAHHGSDGASSETFLKAASPAAAILSYGKENAYGHPHPNLISRLYGHNCKVYGSEVCGAVTVKSDGKTFEIRKYKNPTEISTSKSRNVIK